MNIPPLPGSLEEAICEYDTLLAAFGSMPIPATTDDARRFWQLQLARSLDALGDTSYDEVLAGKPLGPRDMHNIDTLLGAQTKPGLLLKLIAGTTAETNRLVGEIIGGWSSEHLDPLGYDTSLPDDFLTRWNQSLSCFTGQVTQWIDRHAKPALGGEKI